MTFFQGVPFTSAYICTITHKPALEKKQSCKYLKMRLGNQPIPLPLWYTDTQILQQFKYYWAHILNTYLKIRTQGRNNDIIRANYLQKEITSCTCPRVLPKASLRTWRRKTTRLFPPHPVCWCSHGLGSTQNETFKKQVSVQSIWIITRIVSRRLVDSNDFASEKALEKGNARR